MTKLLRTGLSLLLAGTCTFVHSSESAPQRGLLGAYFKGTNLNQPIASRVDSDINFNWGSGSPMKGLPSDNFSVRWSGLFKAPHFSGTRQYRFSTSADDGMRLFFKDRFVIDEWQTQGKKSYSYTASLKPGESASLIVEFVERSGNAYANLTITDVTTGRTIPISKTVVTSNFKLPTANQSQPEITLNSVDLSWTAPLRRMDGSSIALSEIQRYEIYYGLSSKNLSKILKVDSDETFYRFKSLTRGHWHFAIVVVDDKGHKSPRSRIVSKILD